MRIGVNLGIAGPIDETLALAREAERLGFDSAWVSESNGRDSLGSAAWVAAHVPRITVGTAALQMFTRTPTVTAMSAATLSNLSGGRFVLGLGVSTPEILQSWHGVEIERPLERAVEYIEIVRRILESKGERLAYDGHQYRIPMRETSNGFRLRLDDATWPVPIYLASVSLRGVRVATTVCEGCLSLFYSPERSDSIYSSAFTNARQSFDVAAIVPTILGDDLAACRSLVKPWIANYVAGCNPNPYYELFRRYGWEAAACDIRAAVAGGDRRAAACLVPDSVVDELALVGPAPRIRDRLAAWKESRVTTLVAGTVQSSALRLIAEELT